MSEAKSNTECHICYEQFNKSTRSKTNCSKCNLESCKVCIRKYLMDQLDAHFFGDGADAASGFIPPEPPS